MGSHLDQAMFVESTMEAAATIAQTKRRERMQAPVVLRSCRLAARGRFWRFGCFSLGWQQQQQQQQQFG